jgi:MoxR-like ATPase
MQDGDGVPPSALRDVIRRASEGLVEREVLAELIVLSAVAGEHLLVVGPPGTGKSEVVRRVARALGGRYFEYLLGRFTEPSELFGGVDLRRLREGVVETETAGMLPEAEVAFLDEVFLGSTAILNTLLALLNERTFRRGRTAIDVPLRVCVGASNQLPDDDVLAAFADRFLSRVFVDPVPDHALEAMLAGGHALGAGHAPSPLGLAALDEATRRARTVSLDGVRGALATAIRTLRGAGIQLSDRRAVKLQRLVAASAALDGRAEARARDLWPIVYAVPTREEQAEARVALRSLLEAAANDVLPVAAEDASAGPAARAARLVRVGEALLAESPPSDDADARLAWRLRLEGVLRELDAGFAADARPPALAAIEPRLQAAVASVAIARG